MFETSMAPDIELLTILRHHAVPFVITGGMLHKMKKAAGRAKDLLDLENLPDVDGIPT